MPPLAALGLIAITSRRLFATTLLLGAAAVSLAAESAPSREQEVESLAEFARLYGYVRWFHPSDSAAGIDWERFAVLGAQEARLCRNAGELQATLARLFQPLAPTLALRVRTPGIAPEADWPEPLPVFDGRVTFWQHLGVKLSDRPSPYTGRRVIAGEDKGERKPLFPGSLRDTPALCKPLGEELEVRLPMVLAVDAAGRTADGVAPAPGLEALKARLATVDYTKADLNNPAARVAGVVILWNVMQHFFPYHAEAEVDWEAQLRPALAAALTAPTVGEFRDGLGRLGARLHDGHGVFFTELGEKRRDVHENERTAGGLPVRVVQAEGRIVVTTARPGAPFQPGDVIESVAGKLAAQVLAEREELVGGSPHLRRLRALNRFGQGPVGATIEVAVQRDGATVKIPVTLETDDRGYFTNQIPERELPAYAEVAPGVYYVNLMKLEKAAFESHLEELTRARGVIFDWRWDGHPAPLKSAPVSVIEDVIPRLTDRELHSAPFLVPQIMRPDREGWTWRDGGWPLKPRTPRIAGQAVFIDTPGVVSYGETCMAIVDHFKLATLVGEPTAGCNGNVNFVPMPGGGAMMWTGMRVTKHDGTQLYGIGYVPQRPVARTLAGIKAGKDELLDAAIAELTKEQGL